MLQVRFVKVFGFDFVEAYGEVGTDFIEEHHIVPLSEIGTQYTATVDDIAMVCANCHKMLHRGNGMSIREYLHPTFANSCN